MKQRPSECGILDLGKAYTSVEEVVISTPAIQVSQHSGAKKGVDGLDGCGWWASMSSYALVSRCHSASETKDNAAAFLAFKG